MMSPDMSTSWMGILCALVVVMGCTLVWRDTADEPSILQEICKRIVLPRIRSQNDVDTSLEPNSLESRLLTGWTNKQCQLSPLHLHFPREQPEDCDCADCEDCDGHIWPFSPCVDCNFLFEPLSGLRLMSATSTKQSQKITLSINTKTNCPAAGKPLFADWPKEEKVSLD